MSDEVKQKELMPERLTPERIEEIRGIAMKYGDLTVVSLVLEIDCLRVRIKDMDAKSMQIEDELAAATAELNDFKKRYDSCSKSKADS